MLWNRSASCSMRVPQIGRLYAESLLKTVLYPRLLIWRLTRSRMQFFLYLTHKYTHTHMILSFSFHNMHLHKDTHILVYTQYQFRLILNRCCNLKLIKLAIAAIQFSSIIMHIYIYNITKLQPQQYIFVHQPLLLHSPTLHTQCTGKYLNILHTIYNLI